MFGLRRAGRRINIHLGGRMADAALIVRWGTGIPGRETMGLGVFMGSMQFWGQLKAAGDIEDFRVYSFEQGDVSHASGMVCLEGSSEQINAVLDRDDYKMLMVKAGHIVSDMHVVKAETGAAVMKGVERLQSARKELGID